jgi:hypothetical protein
MDRNLIDRDERKVNSLMESLRRAFAAPHGTDQRVTGARDGIGRAIAAALGDERATEVDGTPGSMILVDEPSVGSASN